MKRAIRLMLVVVALAFFQVGKAQTLDTVTFQNNTWHLTKKSAYEAAELYHKDVVFVYGALWCAKTNAARQNMGKSPLREMLIDRYVFWFCESDRYMPFSSEASWAIKDYPHLIPLPKNVDGLVVVDLPLICTVSIGRIDFPVSRRWGDDITSSDALDGFLVGIDRILPVPLKCYYYQAMLYVENDIASEIISVFDMSGMLVRQFSKTTVSASFGIYLPAGVYVVVGKGWARRVVVGRL